VFALAPETVPRRACRRERLKKRRRNGLHRERGDCAEICFASFSADGGETRFAFFAAKGSCAGLKSFGFPGGPLTGD